MLISLITIALALIGLAVVVWSVMVLANKAAERNEAVFERYIQMRVDQRLEQAYDRLADELADEAEGGGDR